MSKNTRTRILLTAVAALLLVTMAVGGTIAYLTDKTSNVENTFNPVHIDIDLYETTTNSFDMVPGVTYDKDPTVKVLADSEACWVFVVVETDGVHDALEYTIDDAWTKLEPVDDTIPGVYYIQQAATASDVMYPVLTDSEVTVSADLKNSDMPDTPPTITFTAYAIQQTGFSTAALAWAEVENDYETYGVNTIPAN